MNCSLQGFYIDFDSRHIVCLFTSLNQIDNVKERIPALWELEGTSSMWLPLAHAARKYILS